MLGGGWVNTELRSLREPRVFDYFDYITLDDGERPLLNIVRRLTGRAAPLVRTFVRKGGDVVLENDLTQHDFPQKDTGIPTYAGLPLDQYVSVMEMLNPMHRFWSDGRWNKITLAHGCYWKKCSFCDVSLDYIGRYDKPSTDLILQRIRALVEETGETGFHLVDEAAPPAGMRALAKRLIAEKLSITWWGNIRFEKTFTPELCRLLAEAGCVAVSGGLEVASDRLLTLMKKGVTVEQVARVTRAFTDAGIMVHAYLMYGFPTETTQDTVDALERVRQLFAAGCIQSAYWHRFAATAHSPIGLHPGSVRHHAAPAAEHQLCAQRHRVRRSHRRGSRFPGRGTAQGALQLHARCRPRGRRARVVRAARGPASWWTSSRTPRRRSCRAAHHRAARSDRALHQSERTRLLIAFNKPFGVICKFSPEPGKRTLADYIKVPNVYPAGRLDTDSEGLLLLTDDGALQARISSPKFKLAKVYWAQVEGVPTEDALANLRKGVDLGDFKTQPAEARLIDEPENLWPRDPPIRYRAKIPTSWIELTLREGKNRQVRRMTAKVGFPTLRLVRAAIGSISVKDLPLGQWREIDIGSLARLVTRHAREQDAARHPAGREG